MIRSITALAILLVASVATAAPKIALPAIEGDVTGDMRDDVAAALDGDQLTVIGEKEVNRAYDRLNLENLAELSEKQAQKMSKDLEADAVVTAVLGKKGKARTLKFRLFVNGKKQRGFTVQFKNAKSKTFRTKLRDKLVGRISGDEEPAKPVVADEETTGPKKRKAKTDPAEDEEDPNPKAKDKKVVEKDDDEQDEDDADKKKKKKDKKVAARDNEDELEEETAIEKRMYPKHTSNRAAIRLDFGSSFGNRSLVFTNRPEFPEGPKPFRSSPVPGARFELEAFPYAFVDPNSILAGFGGVFEYDKTLVLNLGTTAEPGKKIKVDQSHYTVGGRFRFVIGKKPTSPSVTAGFDYGRRRWKADRSVLTDTTTNNGLGSLDLPDTHYQFTAPGLGFRIPFHPSIAFVAYGKALFVSNAGPIQKSNMYGKAKITAGQGEAGFDIVIKELVAIRAMFEFTQFGYEFIGSGGELANSRDMDPDSRDIGGARDRSLGGSLTLGVMY